MCKEMNTTPLNTERMKDEAKRLVDAAAIEIWNHVPPLQSQMFKLCIHKSAKACALIGVDEKIKTVKELSGRFTKLVSELILREVYYLEEIKTEIEKL